LFSFSFSYFFLSPAFLGAAAAFLGAAAAFLGAAAAFLGAALLLGFGLGPDIVYIFIIKNECLQ
jgi:hypothetical protein